MKTEWIDIYYSKKPDDSIILKAQYCAVISRGCPTAAIPYKDKGKIKWRRGGRGVYGVTHWMPLPELPKY